MKQIQEPEVKVMKLEKIDIVTSSTGKESAPVKVTADGWNNVVDSWHN